MLGRKNGRIQEGAKSGKNEKFGILYTRGVCLDRDEVVIRDFCRSHSLNKKRSSKDKTSVLQIEKMNKFQLTKYL